MTPPAPKRHATAAQVKKMKALIERRARANEALRKAPKKGTKHDKLLAEFDDADFAISKLSYEIAHGGR